MGSGNVVLESGRDVWLCGSVCLWFYDKWMATCVECVPSHKLRLPPQRGGFFPFSLQAEFSGGVLVCNKCVAVRKVSSAVIWMMFDTCFIF